MCIFTYLYVRIYIYIYIHIFIYIYICTAYKFIICKERVDTVCVYTDASRHFF